MGKFKLLNKCSTTSTIICMCAKTRPRYSRDPDKKSPDSCGRLHYTVKCQNRLIIIIIPKNSWSKFGKRWIFLVLYRFWSGQDNDSWAVNKQRNKYFHMLRSILKTISCSDMCGCKNLIVNTVKCLSNWQVYLPIKFQS